MDQLLLGSFEVSLSLGKSILFQINLEDKPLSLKKAYLCFVRPILSSLTY